MKRKYKKQRFFYYLLNGSSPKTPDDEGMRVYFAESIKELHDIRATRWFSLDADGYWSLCTEISIPQHDTRQSKSNKFKLPQNVDILDFIGHYLYMRDNWPHSDILSLQELATKLSEDC